MSAVPTTLPSPEPIAASGAQPMQHAAAFRLRRFLNWFPMGLAYAFLYMGRYNLTVAKNSLGDLMTKSDFGLIFLVGTWVYGTAFLLNGPMTDKLGGRRSMLLSVGGAALSNVAIGLFLHRMLTSGDPGRVPIVGWMCALYGLNMYFQSFGAVAIVKVNASWFHVRERGGFSGVFGTMISAGIFFAFTVNGWLLQWFKAPAGGLAPTWIVFFVPAGLLATIGFVELFLLRDKPSHAGHEDFDTGDADSGKAEGPVEVKAVLKRIFTNPIILTIACIEFCTGLVRQGVMQWLPIYVKEVWVLPSAHALVNGDTSFGKFLWALPLVAIGVAAVVFGRRVKNRSLRGALVIAGAAAALAPFVSWGWGGLLFVSGVIGGNVAGQASDRLFGSRRPPVAAALYALLAIGLAAMVFTLGGATSEVGWAKPAPAGADVLLPGDRVVSIAGHDAIRDWHDVSEAVRCVPAACVKPKLSNGPAPFWDPSACTCTTKGTPSGAFATAATIPATVVRGGETRTLAIADPKPAMAPGDTRMLAAGPRLTLNPWLLGAIGFLVSMCVIGTHGVLSGTATMDFGGRKAAATAVGIIDGFVYLGSGLQGIALGTLTTKSWTWWPLFLIPFALIGFALCMTIRNAHPSTSRAAH